MLLDQEINVESKINDDDWKWEGHMYQKFWNKHSLDENKVDEMLNKISWVETKHQNIAQHKVGHGKGYYQMESKTASGAFQTALNSYLNVTEQKNDPPQWVIDAKKHDDARILSKSQQTEVALAAIYQDLGSDKRLKAFKNDEPDALRELWINHWYKGKSKNAKRIQWDNEMIDYKNKKSRSSFKDLVFDNIFEKDLFA